MRPATGHYGRGSVEDSHDDHASSGIKQLAKPVGRSHDCMDMAQRKTTASSLPRLQTVESTATAQPNPCSSEAGTPYESGQLLPKGGGQGCIVLVAVTP